MMKKSKRATASKVAVTSSTSMIVRRKQESRKEKVGKGKGKGKPEKEKIEYQKVVDPITANKAYQLFEIHLLDALEESIERSTLDYAKECAEGTMRSCKGNWPSRRRRKSGRRRSGVIVS